MRVVDTSDFSHIKEHLKGFDLAILGDNSDLIPHHEVSKLVIAGGGRICYDGKSKGVCCMNQSRFYFYANAYTWDEVLTSFVVCAIHTTACCSCLLLMMWWKQAEVCFHECL